MSLKLSKLDSAKRQLETSIRLYFSLGDPVSIHTLSAAAFNILRDLRKGTEDSATVYKDIFLDLIKPEHQKEVRKIINQSENFFKHADKDPNAILDFNPEQTEFMLYEACAMYSQKTKEQPPLFKVYSAWFITLRPTWFKPTKDLANNSLRQEVISQGKEAYFLQALPSITRIST